MMTVDEELFKRISSAYDDVVKALDNNQLGREEAMALMAQILCQLSDQERYEFLRMMDRFYTLNRAVRPQPEEMH
jgi:hypothetical protein